MKHIFLTGSPGVGKSTLISRITQRLQQEHPQIGMCGFWTDEVQQQPGGRIGFDVITIKGTRGPLARVNEQGQGPRVGRYLVDLPAFESLALPELEQAVTRGSRYHSGVGNSSAQKHILCVMDEIGKMELFSPKFFPLVRRVLDQQGVVALGTIPILMPGGRVIKEVEEIQNWDGVIVITVTHQNRDALVSELYKLLLQQLRH